MPVLRSAGIGDLCGRFGSRTDALEKKRGQQQRAAEGATGDSKIHGTHGSAGGKRTFRRKSGG